MGTHFLDFCNLRRFFCAALAHSGTPKDRVQILRKAFMDTMKDPEFLADAKKSKLDIDPLSGEEVQKMVAGMFKLPPALVAKLKEALQ
jgi:tripartite-type tricarboxylate transporter receptor subunit TctC